MSEEIEVFPTNFRVVAYKNESGDIVLKQDAMCCDQEDQHVVIPLRDVKALIRAVQKLAAEEE